jgi:hypothetical protein
LLLSSNLLFSLANPEQTMSTLHLPEGYQYKFYPAKRARHQHVLEVLSPHIPAITLGILALTLLQWHCKSNIYRISDILA